MEAKFKLMHRVSSLSIIHGSYFFWHEYCLSPTDKSILGGPRSKRVWDFVKFEFFIWFCNYSYVYGSIFEACNSETKEIH